MENRDLVALSDTVKKLKAAILETLDTNYQEFQSAINGNEPLRFLGLSSQGTEANEYLIDVSDILFWHDSEAYTDELYRWEGSRLVVEHSPTIEYLRESDQINVFSGLVEAVKRKRVAPFVGAGLSKPCNFPLWGQAIQQLVDKLEGVSRSEERARQPALLYLDEVQQLIDEHDYLKAAQLIYDKNRTQLETFIRNKFDLTPDAIITGPVQLLPDITDGCIVTTNFDGLIESVFSQRNKSIQGYMHGTQSQNQFVSKLIQGDRCILKLHGDVADPDTYIFSQEQYEVAYGKPLDFTKPLAKALRQIFISYSLLFLGCSLEEDMTMTLFREIVNEDGFNIPVHYAILPKPSDHTEYLEKEDRLVKTKIRPIWYEVENGSHVMFESLLRLLVDCSKGRVRL